MCVLYTRFVVLSVVYKFPRTVRLYYATGWKYYNILLYDTLTRPLRVTILCDNNIILQHITAERYDYKNIVSNNNVPIITTQK